MLGKKFGHAVKLAFDQSASFKTASSALNVSGINLGNYRLCNHGTGTNISSGFYGSRKHSLVSNEVHTLEIRFLRKFLGSRKAA